MIHDEVTDQGPYELCVYSGGGQQVVLHLFLETYIAAIEMAVAYVEDTGKRLSPNGGKSHIYATVREEHPGVSNWRLTVYWLGQWYRPDGSAHWGVWKHWNPTKILSWNEARVLPRRAEEAKQKA